MKKILLPLFLLLAPYLSANCCSPFEGLYLSGNVGFAQLNATTTDASGVFTRAVGGFENSRTSWTAGIGAGYDFLSCYRLIGVVTDLNWTHCDINSFYNLTVSTKTKLHWFSTFRARAGLSFSKMLIYLTGGAALTRVHQSISNTFSVPRFISSNKKLWGWTLGFGADFAFCSNWSVNAEILYLNFERHSYSANFSASNVNPFRNYNVLWVGRVGLNYHFSTSNLFKNVR